MCVVRKRAGKKPIKKDPILPLSNIKLKRVARGAVSNIKFALHYVLFSYTNRCIFGFSSILIVQMTPKELTEPASESSGAKMRSRGGRAKAKSTEPRKRRAKRSETYSSYIMKILKQVHPNIGISKLGMKIMNSLIQDTFQRIADESGKLVRYSNKGTLGSREVQTAIRLVLPGELAKHAVSEGTKAVTKFSQA